MSVVSKEVKDVKASDAHTRNVKGGGTVDVPAVPAYKYDVATFTFIDGDSDGQRTFVALVQELFAGEYKSASKALVKGWNFYSKKNAAPKTDAKQLKALRVIAEATGKSLEEVKALMGL
jgi:hypothetical protein